MLWNLRARVRYDVNGEVQTATLTSRTVYSEIQAEPLHAWVRQHHKGSSVEVRYDPSRPDRAVAASSEGPLDPNRTRTDFILLAFAAFAAGALLKLARVLSAREALAAPVAKGGQNGGLALGLITAAMGLTVTGLALYRGSHATQFTADSLMAMPAGLMFVFAGLLIGLPPKYARSRSWLATLVVTCFAITFDWVAFGPGERQFSGGFGIGNIGIGFVPSETIGRVLFGIFAVVLDICAVAMWVRLFGQTPTPNAPAPSLADSTS